MYSLNRLFRKLQQPWKTIIVTLFFMIILLGAIHTTHWVMMHFVDVTVEGKFYE